MPYELPLPDPWPSQGWRAKIFDREGAEEPHVTVMNGVLAWRVSLRRSVCIDPKPPARQLPRALLDIVLANLPVLVAEWDARFGKFNPVQSPPEPPAEVPKKPPKRKRRKKNDR
jgi:hypothetical protein